MEYTVNGLARLAGVSVRTLHWYDEIGLLRPARVTEAGYRMYGPDEGEEIMNCRIPKLTLQPLVENAVRHGVTKREEGGTIWISARFAEPSRRAALPASAAGRPAGHAGQNHFDGRREMCDDRRREI